VTPRDQPVLNLSVQGCSNKEIAGQLSISRAPQSGLANAFSACRNQGWAQTRAIAVFANQTVIQWMPRDRLTAKEIQIADLAWQGLIKNHLRGTFDELGMESA
jgi:DNA-binding CsgD family transcriptional regulator